MGGTPMPVLTTASASRRPRKRPNASSAPTGRPSANAIAVAVSEIRRERPTISQVWASPVTSRRSASVKASQSTPIRSGGLRDLVVGRAGVGREERLAVLLDPERPDHLLRERGDDPVREGVAALRVDARSVRLGDLDHVVDVAQRGAALDEELQAARAVGGEPGPAVADRVRVLVGGDLERRAHPLTGPLVPGAPGLHTRLGPELELERVRPRVVAARDE